MGLSGMHLFLLLILVLLIFGPSRLPNLGRSMGDAVRGFKKGLRGEEIDVTDSIKHENLSPPAADPWTTPPAPKNATADSNTKTGAGGNGRPQG